MPYITPDSIPTETECRQLLIPAHDYILAAVNGQIADLADPELWEQVGGISPEDTAAAMLTMFEQYMESACIAADTLTDFAGLPLWDNTGDYLRE